MSVYPEGGIQDSAVEFNESHIVLSFEIMRASESVTRTTLSITLVTRVKRDSVEHRENGLVHYFGIALVPHHVGDIDVNGLLQILALHMAGIAEAHQQTPGIFPEHHPGDVESMVDGDFHFALPLMAKLAPPVSFFLQGHCPFDPLGTLELSVVAQFRLFHGQ